MKTLSWKNALVAGALLFACAARADAKMVRMCDITGNGTISAYDAHLVLAFVAGMQDLTADQQLLADATGNGHITAYDAMCILKAAVGQTVPGSLCGTLVQVP